jgi:P-type Cu+ transporter
MVYSMLMESDRYGDEIDFTKTDLYKKCVAAGIIPDPSGKQAQASSNNSALESVDGSRTGDGSMAESKNLLSWSFNISGMWCPACAWVVEETLGKSKGITAVSCNFSSDRGKVAYDPVKTSPETIQKTIANLGYSASALQEDRKRSTRDFVRFFITLLFSMNVMMFSWAIYSGFFITLSKNAIQLLSWPVFAMASIVLIYGGFPIHQRALASIRLGTPGMETLISIGSISAYGFSVFSMLEGSIHLYFDAASMLILLVLIGKMLEQSAKNRINEGLADFFSLAPEKVKICTDQFPNGRYVSIKQLAEQDVIQAEQGEILAADGVVIKGDATVDESSITGEAKPINVSPNDTVKSGSKIISGLIQVQALQVGDQSVLGKMLLVMEESLSGRTRQSARFEGLLRYFVPGVVGLSVLTFLYWLAAGLNTYEALNRGLSVMVISCPCALGIAIPLALVAGVSLAGKHGILVRNFEAFENTDGLDTIVFDKTGTLTSGKMQVLAIQTYGNISQELAPQLACALETDSKHYIAGTLKAYCSDKILKPATVSDIQHFPNGISGKFESQPIRLGSLDFVGSEKIIGSPEADVDNFGAQILSQIYLTINDQLAASIQLGDSIRCGVKNLISTLHSLQMSTSLVSGDSIEPTVAVAASAGIDIESSRGGLLPHEKAEFIRALKPTRKKIAMVGDGVNDAAAMAESDLAVAVHSGLNPGEGVAAITLMQEDPVQLLDFIKLAKRVNRTVRQNLIFALIYNLIGIPIAAIGLLNPIVAVTAMLCSSLSVTLNTVLLVKREITPLDR